MSSCWLPIILLLVTPAIAAPNEEAVKEFARFQGRWKLTTTDLYDMNGVPREDVIEGKLLIKGVDYLYLIKNRNGAYVELMKGRFELDPASKPKGIDWLRDDGGHFLGIYEWNGADLKLCMGHLDRNRPKEYRTETGQNVILLKRE